MKTPIDGDNKVSLYYEAMMTKTSDTKVKAQCMHHSHNDTNKTINFS